LFFASFKFCWRVFRVVAEVGLSLVEDVNVGLGGRVIERLMGVRFWGDFLGVVEQMGEVSKNLHNCTGHDPKVDGKDDPKDPRCIHSTGAKRAAQLTGLHLLICDCTRASSPILTVYLARSHTLSCQTHIVSRRAF